MAAWKLSRAVVAASALILGCHALDNGVGLVPPLGWRSYNAFGGTPTQAEMLSAMDVMVDRSRSVDGKPTSLLDLGYNHVGLDGGWNYCFPGNKTFHWKSNGRPVWDHVAFPTPQTMVDKAHTLGLLAGVRAPAASIQHLTHLLSRLSPLTTHYTYISF